MVLTTRRTARWLLGLAVLLGAVSWVGFWQHTEAYERSVGETVMVWTAAQAIPAYAPLAAEMLKGQEVPRRFVTAGAALTQEEIVGKVSAVPLREGDPVTAPLLRSPDLGDRRAITLSQQSTEQVSIDATIQEGDRVDVLVAYREKDQDIARFLLTDVPVVQVGSDKERSVSLLVTAEAARELTWMETFGRSIRVVRRG